MGVAATVLVIDDSDLARRAITRTLRAGGFEVIERESPLGATREVLRNNVSVVVIDVEMPALRGDKLARLFRTSLGNRVALILVSSLDEASLRELTDESGADAYLTKSRVASDLVHLIRRLQDRTRH